MKNGQGVEKFELFFKNHFVILKMTNLKIFTSLKVLLTKQ
jgi:hypothetical protein